MINARKKEYINRLKAINEKFSSTAESMQRHLHKISGNDHHSFTTSFDNINEQYNIVYTKVNRKIQHFSGSDVTIDTDLKELNNQLHLLKLNDSDLSDTIDNKESFENGSKGTIATTNDSSKTNCIPVICFWIITLSV